MELGGPQNMLASPCPPDFTSWRCHWAVDVRINEVLLYSL